MLLMEPSGSILEVMNQMAMKRPFTEVCVKTVIRCVNQAHEAKSANPDAVTADQEAKLDGLVYALYGLTAEEVAAVEGR